MLKAHRTASYRWRADNRLEPSNGGVLRKAGMAVVGGITVKRGFPIQHRTLL